MAVEADGARVLVVGSDQLRTDVFVHACRRRGLDAVGVVDSSGAGDHDGAAALLLDLRSSDDGALADFAAELTSRGIPTLAVHDRSDPRRSAQELDVDGFVEVDSDLDQLVEALREGTGATAITDLASTDGLPSLTDREREVLTELLTGDGTADISARLGISENTVRTHMQNVLGKLGVHSRAEAAAVALRAGLRAPDAAALS